MNATLTNAIIKEGAILLDEHGGVYRNEFDAQSEDGFYHVLINIPYTITYTRPHNSYYYGQVSPGEPVDCTYEIELIISDRDGEEVEMDSRDYDGLVNEIDNKIVIE
jgi:hypothetical protein